MAIPTLSEKDKCPRCSGGKTLERDSEGDIHCWSCGTTFQQNMSYDNRQLAKHQFCEDNKAAILADVKSMGTSATAKKWMVRGAALYQTLKRWGYKVNDKPQEVAASEQGKIIPMASSDGKLPPFPVFSDSWASPVQLKWLELYEKLSERENFA